MTSKEYMALAMRTKSTADPLYHITHSRLLHSALGCADEAGELVKSIKDKLFYNKPLDTGNLKEEYGDLLWYIALGIDAIDSSFEEIMEMNIAKLRARYPDKFTEEKAVNRDLDVERKALETTSRVGVIDLFGRTWNAHAFELCPVCHQPDSCGDCNHIKLTPKEVTELGGRLLLKPPVVWQGSPITVCGLCNQSIDRRFIDGKTSRGFWAIMCPDCYKAHGVGFGAGRGQFYELRGEQYIKTKG